MAETDDVGAVLLEARSECEAFGVEGEGDEPGTAIRVVAHQDRKLPSGLKRLGGVADERADTVARLLVDTKLQEQAKGHVLWIDEAGLLGSKTMAQVFELAERHDFRIVLSGDRKQHGSVDRVLIGQSSESFPASSREQFYVSCSRGRKEATVYTDDRAALLDAVRRSDERLTATELVADRDRYERATSFAVPRYENRSKAEPGVTRRREPGCQIEGMNPCETIARTDG